MKTFIFAALLAFGVNSFAGGSLVGSGGDYDNVPTVASEFGGMTGTRGDEDIKTSFKIPGRESLGGMTGTKPGDFSPRGNEFGIGPGFGAAAFQSGN